MVRYGVKRDICLSDTLIIIQDLAQAYMAITSLLALGFPNNVLVLYVQKISQTLPEIKVSQHKLRNENSL